MSTSKEPSKSPRVIVSVAFRREDFEAVARQAESLGKKVSEFIREAAMEQATGQTATSSVRGFGNSGTLWSGDALPSATRALAQEIADEGPEPVATSA